jgi:hypothetical protein
MIYRSVAFAAAVAAFTAFGAANASAELGTLQCKGGAGMGQVLGSVRQYTCTFLPTRGGKPHRYNATARRIGLDIGVTDSSQIGWLVIAATRYVGPGDLAGTYVGATAGAAIGVGLAANGFVGGMNNAFTLQPLSVVGQRGVNAVGSIGTFELRARR